MVGPFDHVHKLFPILFQYRLARYRQKLRGLSDFNMEAREHFRLQPVILIMDHRVQLNGS